MITLYIRSIQSGKILMQLELQGKRGGGEFEKQKIGNVTEI